DEHRPDRDHGAVAEAGEGFFRCHEPRDRERAEHEEGDQVHADQAADEKNQRGAQDGQNQCDLEGHRKGGEIRVSRFGTCGQLTGTAHCNRCRGLLAAIARSAHGCRRQRTAPGLPPRRPLYTNTGRRKTERRAMHETAREPASLNPAQHAAVTHGERCEGGFRAGPLLVIAGAGTGKTMTVAHRVAPLVLEGVAPERLLLLTFTRRAAEEMTRRAERIVRAAACKRGLAGTPTRLPWAGTFHSIANRLLRRFAANLGLDPGFSVADRGDAADLLDVLRHDLGLSGTRRRFPGKDTCLAIYSRCVNARLPLPAVLEESFPWCAEWEAELRQLFRCYGERKQRSNVLDYDDLLLYWRWLVDDGELAAAIGGMFDHVLVDEYQDTNRLQAEILAALKPDGAGVTVVGDDAQSIYSFRAAEVDNILQFAGGFTPPARIVTLERNYRSTQPILDAANALIAESTMQYRKRLVAARQG